MKGKDLLQKLQGLTPEQLELPVYVWADHGQTTEAAAHFQLGFCTEYDLYLDDVEVHPDDTSEYDEGELLQFIVIS
jgi:hypothetical protein